MTKGPLLELAPQIASIFPLQRQLLAAAGSNWTAFAVPFSRSPAIQRSTDCWQQVLSLWQHCSTSVTSVILQSTRPPLQYLQMGCSNNRQPELLFSQVKRIIRALNVRLDFYTHIKSEQNTRLWIRKSVLAEQCSI